MNIIDISQKYSSNMVKYPSISPLEHEYVRHYEKGNGMCLSQVKMQMHLGTHIDAPFHYCEQGKKISELDLQIFYGDCQVIEINENGIGKNELMNKVIQSQRVLFKTKNSRFMDNNEFVEEYVYIEKSGAEYLLQQGVKLVGTDYFSVDPYKDINKAAHKILLGAGAILLEGINLSPVNEGKYLISCFPLNMEGSEGAPCRAVIIK